MCCEFGTVSQSVHRRRNTERLRVGGRCSAVIASMDQKSTKNGVLPHSDRLQKILDRTHAVETLFSVDSSLLLLYRKDGEGTRCWIRHCNVYFKKPSYSFLRRWQPEHLKMSAISLWFHWETTNGDEIRYQRKRGVAVRKTLKKQKTFEKENC